MLVGSKCYPHRYNIESGELYKTECMSLKSVYRALPKSLINIWSFCSKT